jgi:hypothetical protein
MNINSPDSNNKPSGTLKLFLRDKNDNQQINCKHKYILSFLKTNLSSLFMLFISVCSIITIISFNFIGSENISNNDSDNSNRESNAELARELSGISENMEYYFTTDKILGTWRFADYVENVGDFDINEPSYRKYNINNSFGFRIEFFDDRTAILNAWSDIEIYSWINGDILSILPNNADIIIREIKKINGNDYLFAEIKQMDLKLGLETRGYYVLSRGIQRRIDAFEDARNKDLRNYDFSKHTIAMIHILFNENTRFPHDMKKMPQLSKYQPYYIMERGKNPGLGVRALHEQGTTGKGINVAIIGEPLNIEHPEYKGKIIEYKNFGCELYSGMQGAAVASLLAGENIGTAPGVNIYYAAVPPMITVFAKTHDYDAVYYAEALKWIIEINNSLPDSEKIRVVSIFNAPTSSNSHFKNIEKYLESYERATRAGILVLDCSPENSIIGACTFDFDNPDDVTLCRPGYANGTRRSWRNRDNILAPAGYRTMAEVYNGNEFSYQYDGTGSLSWAIPYTAGVLAMGWQVKPELRSDEIVKILFDTAYVDKDNYKYIYPIAFIEYLKNN